MLCSRAHTPLTNLLRPPAASVLAAASILAAGILGAGAAAPTLADAVLSPTFGAWSGEDFNASLIVPSPPLGGRTRRIVLFVPSGVVDVQPGEIPGWRAFVERPAENGSRPERVVFEALGTAQVEESASVLCFPLNLRLGCSFDDARVATSLPGERYALWWRTEQIYEFTILPIGKNTSSRIEGSGTDNMGGGASVLDGRVMWEGISQTLPDAPDAPDSGQGLAPYIFVESSVACRVGPKEGRVSAGAGADEPGMMWLGVRVLPKPGVHTSVSAEMQALEEQNEANRARIATLEAEKKHLQSMMKQVGVETDREFDGQDPKAHDHSMDYRKGHHIGEGGRAQMGGEGGPTFEDQVGLRAAKARARHGSRQSVVQHHGYQHLWSVLKVLGLISGVVLLAAGATGAIGGTLAFSARSLLFWQTGDDQRLQHKCFAQALSDEEAVPTACCDSAVAHFANGPHDAVERSSVCTVVGDDGRRSVKDAEPRSTENLGPQVLGATSEVGDPECETRGARIVRRREF